MESISQPLVVNRECGNCSVCCKQPTINTPELKKLPGVLCQHCKEGLGCQIYETRPPICRIWFCGWRVMPQLDDAWRPDLSEILITLDRDRIPAGYSMPALKLELVGSLQKIRWMPLVNLIATAIAAKTPVFLAVPGGPGRATGIAFLNDNLGPAVSSRNLDLMVDGLADAVRACVAHPKEVIDLGEH